MCKTANYQVGKSVSDVSSLPSAKGQMTQDGGGLDKNNIQGLCGCPKLDSGQEWANNTRHPRIKYLPHPQGAQKHLETFKHVLPQQLV